MNSMTNRLGHTLINWRYTAGLRSIARMLYASLLAGTLLLMIATSTVAQAYGVSRRTTVVRGANTTVVRRTTVVHGGAALPHGYIATLPGGYRPIYIGGVRYYAVGGIHYRPQIYAGRTVYVRVHI